MSAARAVKRLNYTHDAVLNVRYARYTKDNSVLVPERILFVVYPLIILVKLIIYGARYVFLLIGDAPPAGRPGPVASKETADPSLIRNYVAHVIYRARTVVKPI